MRRYQKWLSVGLLALTPGITLAGPFSKKDPKAGAPTAAPKRVTASNQEQAEKVKAALKKAKLTGYEIDISVAGGIATLSGMVGSPAQRAAATKAAESVPGLRCDNRLTVAEPTPRGAIQQAGASQPQPRTARPARAPRGAIQQAAAYDGIAPSEIPAEAPMQPEAMAQIPQGISPGYAPQGPAPAPMYGPPVAGASHTIYNQPNNPNYAWPAYAQYPNYAAVTYPTQYSASAWPYIGPFYPYPQVPLGWRKATLEWDDGYWNLSFSPRTDRWWWFLDWRNW